MNCWKSDILMLRISLMGQFRLVYDDTAVTHLNTPSHQALLAYLVLHADQIHTRQHLAFTFWPDSNEGQARTNLRKAIYHLRHNLPDADRFLHLEKQTVQWRLDAPYVVDVAQFEQLLSQNAQDTHTSASLSTAFRQAQEPLKNHSAQVSQSPISNKPSPITKATSCPAIMMSGF